MDILAELTQAEQEGIAGGIIGGMAAMMFACILIFAVLLIIAEWKLFTKAGEAGWKTLIPIYNLWVAFKIVGIAPINAIILVVCEIVVNMIAASAQGSDPGAIFGVCTFILLIYAAVIGFMYCWKLAKAYGRGVGTFIGLILLPNIFTLILGFGSAKYNKKYMYKSGK